jgi:zinc transport system substrate-binding protein
MNNQPSRALLLRHLTALWIAAAIVFFAVAAPAVAQDKLSVVSVNYPLHYLASRIGGELIEVSMPFSADIDPAFWQPTADEVARIQQADLILRNGAGYAKWARLAALPRRKMVDTSASFRDRFIATPSRVTHQHGPEGAHAHGDVAFTTWLDPTQALAQADAIHQALVRRLPTQKEAIDANFARVKSDLAELDKLFEGAFARAAGAPLFASHPIYQYLGRRYRLEIFSFLWEPDEAPPEDDWSALQRVAKSRGIRFMLWEGEPAAITRRRLAALGISVIVVAPAMNAPARGDFLSVMQGNAENVRRAGISSD